MLVGKDIDWQMQQVRRLPVPSHREQIVLGRAIRAWQDHPDGPDAAPARVQRAGRKALNRLVTGNLRLVCRQIKAYASSCLESEDLLQAGSEGLIAAALRFKPGLGYTFSTYATWWVRQSMQRLGTTRHAIAVPEHVSLLAYRLRKRASELIAKGEDRVTYGALVEGVRERANRTLSPERAQYVLAQDAHSRCLSLCRGTDSTATSLHETVGDGHCAMDAMIASERIDRVRQALEELDPVERDLIVRIDLGGQQRVTASRELGLSLDVVLRRRQQAQAKLSHLLADLAVA